MDKIATREPMAKHPRRFSTAPIALLFLLASLLLPASAAQAGVQVTASFVKDESWGPTVMSKSCERAVAAVIAAA